MTSQNNKIKYDDFGAIVWQEPKRKRKPKKFTYAIAFKQLGEALF